MTINILDYLEHSSAGRPGKTVFSDGDKTTTYSELVKCGKSMAAAILNATGKARLKPVAVFVDRSIESLVQFIGTAYSGNFYAPIDMQMPKHRIELILKTLQPVAIIAGEEQEDMIRGLAGGIPVIRYQEAVYTAFDEDLLAAVRNRMIDLDPAYATFTSGSTGVPKGVITCHRSVIDMTEALVGTFDFNEYHVFGNQNPFYFDASIKDIYSTLKCGATMIIIPRSCFVFPATLVGFINRNKIDTILWSAAAIAHAANTDAFEAEKPESLKKVMFSGEVMHNRTLNYWRRALPQTLFVNLYGPTEITSVCTYYKVLKPFGDDEPLPIGVPFRNTEIMLLNEADRPVQGDEIGEICVRGCCLALGYYNNPEKTREAFVQNPLNHSYPEVLYRTGDIARYNSLGEIMFLSRKDNQVKHMGQRVELGEIELAVNALDSIKASICFYDHDKEKIVLVVQGEEIGNKAIIDGIKNKLPKYMFPNIIIRTDEMPYNLNNKIDRALLKQKYRNGELG
jgi:D-alanine--poly(phosphoribitol) ligase subunit 1